MMVWVFFYEMEMGMCKYIELPYSYMRYCYGNLYDAIFLPYINSSLYFYSYVQILASIYIVHYTYNKSQ